MISCAAHPLIVDQCGDEQKKLQGLTISINFVPCLFLCLRLLLLLPWQLLQYKLSLKMRQVRKLNSSWKHPKTVEWNFMTCICTLYCHCDWRHLQQCMSSCLIRGTPSPASGRSLRRKVNVYRRKQSMSHGLWDSSNIPLEHTLTSYLYPTVVSSFVMFYEEIPFFLGGWCLGYGSETLKLS